MPDIEEKTGTRAGYELRDDDKTLHTSYRRDRRSYTLVYLFGIVVVLALVAYVGMRDRTSGASAPSSSTTRVP